MNKYPLFLLALLILTCARNEQQITRLDGSQISTDKLTAKIQSVLDSARVNGLSIAVFNQNKVVYSHDFGFANVKTGDSLKNKPVFYGASFSKAVFGYLVAQLVNEGKLDLDTPLQSYLNYPLPNLPAVKEWKGFKNLASDERYKLLTARMCMSHSTGFPNWRWMTKENDFFREGKIRFLIDPGTRYSYSGEGIYLLQRVIEEISGAGLEELAQERIFKPLQMQMTSYIWQERFADRYSNGHKSDQSVVAKDTEDEANAAGSMETTLADMSRFISKLLELYAQKSAISDLLFSPNIRIRSKTQFGFQAWRDTTANDAIELSYGLGMGLLTSPYGKAAFKEGHGDGFQHYFIIFPEQKTGVIIMSNSDNAESTFKELLEISIGDIYTPWQWERYIPYNQ